MPDIDFNVNPHEPGNSPYNQHIARAFTFFRMHAEGRYSDSTMMRLADANDSAARSSVNPYEEDDGSGYENANASRRRRRARSTRPLPMLFVAERPYSYDADTEVKTGGVLGMCVTWREDAGRSILAVHREYRRSNIGRSMLTQAGMWTTSLSMWVARGNTVGQQFLLAQGLFPTGMNATGVLRFSNQDNQEEE